MHVTTGTTNPTKVNAVERVFRSQFASGDDHRVTDRAVPRSTESVQVFPFEIESAVSATPRSDRECIEGAIFRAKESYRIFKENGSDEQTPERTFGVGLEAGISSMDDPSGEMGSPLFFLCAWAAVLHVQSGKISVGCSARAPLSAKFLAKMTRKSGEDDKEMKEVLAEVSGIEEISKKEGGISLLTDGAIHRQHLNEQALHCALAPFVCPSFIL